MFCPNCGKELKEAEKFCPACGRRLPDSADAGSAPAHALPVKWLAIGLIAVAAVLAVLLILQKKPHTVTEAAGSDAKQIAGQAAEPDSVSAESVGSPVELMSQPSVAPQNTPIPMADYEWLENQAAIKAKSGNFVPKYWDVSDKFVMSGEKYSHGVCLTMKGSKYETVVTPGDGGPWSEPYDECFVDVPFGQKFFKMSFDIGFDEAHLARYGAPDANGNARLVLTDVGNDRVLYDTGIVDYSFQEKWVNIDTSDVNVLRITYQVAPVVDRQKTSLNLLLGKALMYKLGDGYEMTEDYTPVLTALPTDYRQFEPNATDYIERFILRGYHDRYTRVELEQFSKDEMELVLNGVYALSGKWFQRAELWNYFTTKNWYYPIRIDITDAEKNNIQQANESTITAYMKDMGWR